MSAFVHELDVSRETRASLERYAQLLRLWTRRINLVSRRSLDELWDRHIVDSAQLYRLRPSGAQHWVDLGSGGGLPGLVIAILARQSDPELEISLVESDQRKGAFLTTVARELDLRLTVHVQRAEVLAPLRADVLSARALAPLSNLLDLAARHLAPTGRALFPKGARHDEEIACALATWRFDLQKMPSCTDRDGAILMVEGIARV